MKASKASVSRTAGKANDEFLARCEAAAKAMAREVRAEHRRWNLPLLSERGGKIVARKP